MRSIFFFFHGFTTFSFKYFSLQVHTGIFYIATLNFHVKKVNICSTYLYDISKALSWLKLDLNKSRVKTTLITTGPKANKIVTKMFSNYLNIIIVALSLSDFQLYGIETVFDLIRSTFQAGCTRFDLVFTVCTSGGDLSIVFRPVDLHLAGFKTGQGTLDLVRTD